MDFTFKVSKFIEVRYLDKRDSVNWSRYFSSFETALNFISCNRQRFLNPYIVESTHYEIVEEAKEDSSEDK